VGLSLAVVIGVRPLWEASQEAAQELLDPQRYIELVLERSDQP